MDAATILFVVLAIVILLIIARLVYRLLLGQGMTETLINSDNKAAAVSLGGFLLGVIQVVIPVLAGPSHTFWADVAGVAAYGVGGIIAMAVAGVIFEEYSKWAGAPLRQQIAEGNLSAGIIDGAIFFASSQIVAGALSGDEGSLVPTIVFWAAGVVALIVFTQIFRSLTSYNDADSIKSNNVAAALGCAGLIIAIGIMAGKAVSGNFTGYAQGFRDFGMMMLATVALYPVRQIIVQMLFLGGGFSFRNGRLDHEIAQDRNVGAGLLEAVGYIATAMIVTRLF